MTLAMYLCVGEDVPVCGRGCTCAWARMYLCVDEDADDLGNVPVCGRGCG